MNKVKYKIVLGSSSKFRKAVLSNFLQKLDPKDKLLELYDCTNFLTLSPEIDEKAIRSPDPTILTSSIANAKADALVSLINKKINEKDSRFSTNIVIITCDEVVVANKIILEKPETAEEARTFLRGYANFPAECYCGVVVTCFENGKRLRGSEIAIQHFLPIPEPVIEDLIKKRRNYDLCWRFCS